MIKIEFARPIITSVMATMGMDEEQKKTAKKLFAGALSVVREGEDIRLVKGEDDNAIYGCEAVIAYMQSLGMKPHAVNALSVSYILDLAGTFDEAYDLLWLLERVKNRNDRVKKLGDLGAPKIIMRNEYRLLWESVERLFFNPYLSNPASYTCEDGEEHIRTCVMDLILKMEDDKE